MLKKDNHATNKKKIKPIAKRFLHFFSVVIGCVVLISVVTGASIYNYSKTDETKIADAAIVLGAGTNGSEPTPVFQERLNHGIWLYKEGYTDTLILTGGYGKNNKISDSVIAKKYVVESGVPEDAIVIEEISIITQENLYYAKQIMDKSRHKKVLIVSDPLHMKRAMLLAEDLNIKAFSSPTRTSVYKSWWSKTNFLCREVILYVGYNMYNLLNSD